MLSEKVRKWIQAEWGELNVYDAQEIGSLHFLPGDL